MALSSNWQKLQTTKKVVTKTKKVTNANKVYKPKAARKGSKIMNMVYNINNEIAKQKLNKEEGKVFEFKTAPDTIISETSEAITLQGNITSNKAKEIGKFIAMDCEFVGVGPEGKESALARISIVNFFGHVIMDEYVKPREKVTDWRTWVSGIKSEHMKNAISFKEAQKKTADILKGRILVGHAVKHDLEALLLSHPKIMIRDTSRHLPYRQKYAKGKSPSLKKLTKEVLKLEIQTGEHSSVQDAQATMLLYKVSKKEFEHHHKTMFGFESR
ncbi:putative 3'-5' exonuclease NDAI_0B02830 [Naumovozyma dairenensis CBS 421]|uniref:RNA exonuclease 4 n=1 Tax=Naumovozyma dairenensis (strain ATCC 10597 / BCRC 20456 / CBS 421 / NBRC 0211 / NRRL Y-12639) TaxID=1071378 RepID=G0W6A7_NAUDC|nr:hypothetical protein NDAI_0B02830 [Naumovozyma dairenensis CBS 421]CCD23318.1 hypothetical protein NDAI_0B02830 [Naumovozyma dairenensis CBS 421]